jgi:hypothetical protein
MSTTGSATHRSVTQGEWTGEVKKEGSTMKKRTRWLAVISCSVLVILGFHTYLRAETSGEEVLEKYPGTQFKVDFTDDGKQDTLSLDCKKVKDFSTNPYTNETTKEKFVWYQFHVTIVSPEHETLWDDTYSSKDEDYQGLFDHFDVPFLKPEDYLKKFFSEKFNGIEKRKIRKDEIDEDLLRKIIKDMKSKVSVKDIEKEILDGKHTVVFYRGDWAEDLRQTVYSKKLHSAFGLTSPY